MSRPEEGSDRSGERERPELRVGSEERAVKPESVSLYGALIGWLITYGERAGDALVYSSAYLAVIATVEVAIAMVLLSIPPNPAPIVMGLVTFAVYANDRLVDVDADEVTNPDQAAFVRRHEEELYVLAAVAYGLATALSVLGGPVTLAITLVPGVFWVLYAREWISDVGVHARRLKDLLVVNSTVVALGWAVALTFLPVGFADASITPSVLVVFGYFFLGTFVNAEVPNVYDMEGDEEIGVRTLPIVFGVRRTRRALYGIDVLNAALVGAATLHGLLPAAAAAALFAGLAYSLSVTALLGRTENGTLHTIAAESEYVFVGLALVPIVFGG